MNAKKDASLRDLLKQLDGIRAKIEQLAAEPDVRDTVENEPPGDWPTGKYRGLQPTEAARLALIEHEHTTGEKSMSETDLFQAIKKDGWWPHRTTKGYDFFKMSADIQETTALGSFRGALTKYIAKGFLTRPYEGGPISLSKKAVPEKIRKKIKRAKDQS
jgi:hypothetical protein